MDDEQQGSGKADTMQLLVPERCCRVVRNRLNKLLQKEINILQQNYYHLSLS